MRKKKEKYSSIFSLKERKTQKRKLSSFSSKGRGGRKESHSVSWEEKRDSIEGGFISLLRGGGLFFAFGERREEAKSEKKGTPFSGEREKKEKRGSSCYLLGRGRANRSLPNESPLSLGKKGKNSCEKGRPCCTGKRGRGEAAWDANRGSTP